MSTIDHAHEVLARRRATLAAIGGRHDLARLLRSRPDELIGCPVHLVLRACPYIGDGKVRELCTTTGVWPLALLGHLTTLEREALARVVEL